MLNSRRWIAGLVTAWLLGGSAASSAQVGYGQAGEYEVLSRVELPGGALHGSTLPGLAMSGLAISPDAELFGVSGFYLPGPFAAPARLARVVDGGTSVEIRGTLAVPTADPHEDMGLAFDVAGRLWLLTVAGLLYEVNPTNAAVTQRLNLGIPTQGLAGCGTSLFTVSQEFAIDAPARLVRIEPDVGSWTYVGVGSASVAGTSGIGLDFAPDGRLWSVMRTRLGFDSVGFLVELDPVSGEHLSQELWVGEYVNALAIGPPPASCQGLNATEVPTVEGGGLVLIATLLAVLAFWTLARKTPAHAR